MTRHNDNAQQHPSGAGESGVVPGSYGAQVQLACEEADQIEVLAQKVANPGLFRLYAYASSAVDNAVTIVKYTRQTAFPSAGEFVGQQTRLSVLLKRFKAISDLPSLWATWPQAPGETLSWLAGSSALDVAIQFAKMILATTVISGREIRLDGSYGYGQLPVFPEAHVCFVKWRDMTFEQILTRQAPKPDVWPTMADIHREYNSLKYKMRAEYEAAVKTADSNRASGLQPGATPQLRRKRKKRPGNVDGEVLTSCRRRCCLCFGLKGDASEKPGQIAHMDGDPSNNDRGNLVYLCLEHHDKYDTRTSQSKGLTIEEVRHYRDELHRHLGTQLRTAPGRCSCTPPGPSLLSGSTSLAGHCNSIDLDPSDAEWVDRKRLCKPFLSAAAKVVANCTWDRILLAIGGTLGLGRSYAHEAEIRRALSRLLIPKVPNRILQNELFDGVLVQQVCVQSVAHHLVASGVVEVKAFDTYKRLGKYWRLTKSGQKHYAVLRDRLVS